jgi:hypothetical protein
MVKCGVLFEVRTEFLNFTHMTFGFRGLMLIYTELYLQVDMAEFFWDISPSMEQIYFQEASSCTVNQETPHLLCNTKVLETWPRSRIQSQMNPIYILHFETSF